MRSPLARTHRSSSRRLPPRIWILAVCAIVGLVAVLSPAQAASPPSATTGAATAVTQTSAVLTGTLNTVGLPGTYQFMYGTSTSYGESTAPQPITTSSAQSVSATVTGLSPGTTYHFELVATVGESPYSQTVSGGDQQFTTNSAPGGSIKLLSKTLTVKNGAATASLKCASTNACRGGLSITTTQAMGTVLLTVRCVASKSFTVTAGGRRNVKAKLRRGCLKLLSNAANRRRRARLVASPSTGQPVLATAVTLILK